MRDQSSLTRDRTSVPCIRRHILNHWTTGEVLPLQHFLTPRLLSLHVSPLLTVSSLPLFILMSMLPCFGGFPGGSVIKNPPAVQDMRVQSLGGEDPLEEGMATHSSIPAWRIPGTEEPDGLQSTELQRVGHGVATKQQQYATSQSRFTKTSSSSIFRIVCDSLQISNPCTSLEKFQKPRKQRSSTHLSITVIGYNTLCQRVLNQMVYW